MDSNSDEPVQDETVGSRLNFEELRQGLAELDRILVEQFNEDDNRADYFIIRSRKIRAWRGHLKHFHDRMEWEISCLQKEKAATHKQIESFAVVFNKLIEFPPIDDGRTVAASLFENIKLHFKNELDLLVLKQQQLMDKCAEAEAALKNLIKLKGYVDEDLADKDAGPDPENHAKYFDWVQDVNKYGQDVMRVIRHANNVSSALFELREMAHSEVNTQRECSLKALRTLIQSSELHSITKVSLILENQMEIGRRSDKLVRAKEDLRIKTNQVEYCREQLANLHLNMLLVQLRQLESEKAELEQNVENIKYHLNEIVSENKGLSEDNTILEKAIDNYKLAYGVRRHASRLD